MDADSQELLERRLSEKVEAEVSHRLFRVYRAIWATATGVLAVAGGWVLLSIPDYAREETRGLVEDVIAPAVAEAEKTQEDVADALLDAQVTLSEAMARLQMIDEFLARREAALQQFEDRVVSAEAALASRLNEIQVRLDAMSSEADGQIEAVRLQFDAAKAEISTGVESELAAARQRISEAAAAADLTTLSANLADLTAQVETLHAALCSPLAGAQGPGCDGPGTEELRRIRVEAVETAARAAAPTGAVYFQFAGVPREVVERLADRLRSEDWDIPGEERVAAAAGLHEVRYFHDGDRDRATRLAEELNALLAAQDFAANVEARDFTGYPDTKPREGTIEVWIEPRPI